WRFRLAPDLVVQLQPREDRGLFLPHDRARAIGAMPFGPERSVAYNAALLRSVVLFEGLAFIGDVAAEVFTDREVRRAAQGSLKLSFVISRLDATGEWIFRARGAWWDRTCPVDSPTGFERLREALSSERFATFTPDLMLKPACMMCGKGLTDPASMARWIGPE